MQELHVPDSTGGK